MRQHREAVTTTTFHSFNSNSHTVTLFDNRLVAESLVLNFHQICRERMGKKILLTLLLLTVVLMMTAAAVGEEAGMFAPSSYYPKIPS